MTYIKKFFKHHSVLLHDNRREAADFMLCYHAQIVPRLKKQHWWVQVQRFLIDINENSLEAGQSLPEKWMFT